MTTYRLFPSTSGPTPSNSYTGGFQAGVAFQVTQGGLWLDGYYYWCGASGQPTAAVTAALWQFNAPGTGHFVVVPNSGATSGALTKGAWNFIPLATPLPLSQNVAYEAVTGQNITASGFPETQNQFGSGQPYAAGITSGPLMAYSDAGGSAAPPASMSQGAFGTGSTSGGSASANFPGLGSDSSANFWVDLLIDTAAPANASYSLFPSQPYPVNQFLDTANNFTLGVEFQLSQPCTLNEILFYSPATVTQLPTECAIYVVGTQAILAGTHQASPSWSGAAGSGWISAAYASPPVLAANTKYKAVVFNGAGSPAIWNAATGPHYWDSPGPASGGITNGVLSAPNNATADSPGQSSFHQGAAIAWPDTNVGAYNYWVDVSVTPQASGQRNTWWWWGESLRRPPL